MTEQHKEQHPELRHIGCVALANCILQTVLGTDPIAQQTILDNTQGQLKDDLEYIIDFLRAESVSTNGIRQDVYTNAGVALMAHVLRKEMESYYGNVV